MLIILKSLHPFRPVFRLQATGYSILLKFDKAAICCLLTVIGGFIVYRWYKIEVKIPAQTGTFSNNPKQQAK